MTTTRDYAADGRKADELCTDARTIRALEQELTVLGPGINPALDEGEYEVVSESGSTYIVDVFAGSCTCPDHDNGNRCKHLRRTVRETGMMPTSALLLDALDVSDQFNGEHVDGEPKIVPPQDALETTADTGKRAVADGGRGRPADCSCITPSKRDDGRELPCFPCYEAGFRSVNPEVDDQ
ncbi:SWIM zinc finger family protein [Natrinema hispanicum]|nr:SWIM zinc finger family protein [Natrinema hispanicum]